MSEPDAPRRAPTTAEVAAFLNQLTPAEVKPTRTGTVVVEVLIERFRQMNVEGWTEAHDDEHQCSEIAVAAACYALFAGLSDDARMASTLPGGLTVDGKPRTGWSAFMEIWPWDRKWWKPSHRRRDLVKAAAMIIAEIERLDRKDFRKAQEATWPDDQHS